MSVTVADLMKLPCLREARVVAGAKGLSRPVTSISVLEYATPDTLQDQLYHSIAFNGGELVITGFINIKDDVAAQCSNIRHLAEAGEVGLILYYVGIFMPGIHPQLCALADALDFALICMPENRLNLRYSEVICEVMETIFKEQQENATLVSDILERVSLLPEHQRSVDTVLKLLSDRTRATAVLLDSARRILGQAAWPRAAELPLAQLLPCLPDRSSGSAPTLLPGSLWPGGRVYLCPLAGQGAPMDLLLLKAGVPLSPELLRQCVEVVQLAVHIWSRHHAEVVVSELVQAILKDEPMKMRRLADIFRIDVASIHTMWVVRANQRQQRDAFQGQAAQITRELLAPHCRTVVIDFYEGDLVVFPDSSAAQEHAHLADALCAQLAALGLDTTLTVCNELSSTADVRRAFLANTQCLASARIIWPQKPWYTLQEIQFTHLLRETLAQGEAAVEETLAVLAPLNPEREKEELLHTLAVYLLDAESSVTRCAALLFLHKNTVKYRLQRISDRLGHSVNKMPETFALYHAAALRRLLAS